MKNSFLRNTMSLNFVIEVFFRVYITLVILILGPGLICFSFILKNNESIGNFEFWLILITGILWTILTMLYSGEKVKILFYPNVSVGGEENENEIV